MQATRDIASRTHRKIHAGESAPVLALPLATCATLGHQSSLCASESYLKDVGLLSPSALKFQILWKLWVFLTLKSHHCRRSKDTKPSANKGQITHWKASTSKGARLRQKPALTVASRCSLERAGKMKASLLEHARRFSSQLAYFSLSRYHVQSTSYLRDFICQKCPWTSRSIKKLHNSREI